MTALAQTFRSSLADKWRYSAIEVDECLRFIRQHRRTIAERDERLPCGVPVHSAAYVAEARKLLSLRLDLYRAAARRVFEAEAEMDRLEANRLSSNTPAASSGGRETEMPKTVRTKSFRDEHGNRFIFPSFIIDDEKDGGPTGTDIIFRAMEMSVIMGLKADDGWFEFDPDTFPHVRTIAASRAFQHGGATILIFEGPEFDAALAEAQPA